MDKLKQSLKLISLNTWGGRIRQIDDFIKQYAHEVDIFCFQEMYKSKAQEAEVSAGERPNFFEEIENLLPDFHGFFASQAGNTGLAIFIHKNLEVEEATSYPILLKEELINLQMADGRNYYPRIVQVVKLKEPGFTILNFHGLPGKEKKDSEERQLQMKRLHEILEKYTGKKILVGDFNLRPDTEAIHGLETHMKNLVIEGGFQTTRTSLYTKKELMPFADYTFVTPEIEIKSFAVLPDEVSDHSAMLLEFDNL